MKKQIRAKQAKIKLYSFDQVFKKRGAAFERGYVEESLRIMLAEEIRSARTAKRLTQDTLAKRAGMPQSIVARLESGTHGVSVATLGKIAHALGKRVALA